VDVSSGEELACQKDSASEVPEDVEAPISALVTLQNPDPKTLEGPTVLIVAPVAPQGLQESVVVASVVSSSLEGPVVASLTANLPLKGARLQELTATSSAVTPPSERVNPQELAIASPAVNVYPPEGMRPQEPITTSSAVATPPQDRSDELGGDAVQSGQGGVFLVRAEVFGRPCFGIACAWAEEVQPVSRKTLGFAEKSV
jgi:hypothetical protein